MKQLAISGIQFLGITVGGYLLGFALLFFIQPGGVPMLYRLSNDIPWKGGGTYQRFQEFSPGQQYDVLILGSSLARQGYDPRKFEAAGLKSFNLGTSGQTMMHSYLLAQTYLSETPPKMILLDLFSGAFRGDGYEPAADLIQNQPSESLALRVAWNMKDIRALNLLTTRWFSAHAAPLYESEYYTELGFEERKDSVQKDLSYQTSNLPLNPDQLEYFQKLVQFCDAHQIRLICIQQPKPHQSDGRVHAAFLATLEELLSGQEIEIWDYSSGHTLNDRHHFYDHHHLNQAGVDIFNQQLLERLEILPAEHTPNQVSAIHE